MTSLLDDQAGCSVMGIVNRTPDSFFDGGRMDLDRSIEFALTLGEQGAAILDIGAVKAGPGAEVSEAEELERMLPLVEGIVADSSLPLSVETSRPSVAKAAIEAGASIVNDVTALADPGLAEVCAESGAWLVVMHSGGQIRGRPRHPHYDDVVVEVASDLLATTSTAISLGMERARLIVDPGLDFGKNTFHSLELMKRLTELTTLGFPLLVAPSHKDVVGETLGLPVGERLEGTLALVALSVWQGADIVRVHDVAAAVRVVKMTEAVAGARMPAAPLRGLWD